MSLLEKGNVDYKTIEYLKRPLNKEEVLSLSKKLNLPPAGFVRKKEAEFKDNNLSSYLENDEAMAEAIARYPKIMERPIVVKDNRAVIGRPPENILTLIC